MTPSDYPVPYSSRVLRENGHMIEIVTLRHTALHSGRPLYRVECIDCGDRNNAEVISEATTAPDLLVNEHIRNRPKLWPRGLDWNHTGRWAVIMHIAGKQSDPPGAWTLYASVSISRWELKEAAEEYVSKHDVRESVTAVLLEWGEDLETDWQISPRVLQALERAGVK